MVNIHLKLQREPYIPKIINQNVRKAQDEIASAGGVIHRFSINGCSNVLDLENFIIEKYGVSRFHFRKALEAMLDTYIAGIEWRVRDVWGIVEKINEKYVTTFIGFAFTDEELEQKSQLFVAGVQEMKNYLEISINQANGRRQKTASWDL